MPASITLQNVHLDLPIFDVSGQSLKKRVLRMGRRNRIAEDSTGVVVVRAIDDLSLTLESGDRLGLIGHNGAGKSTLLRVMAGIYPPTAGHIAVQGKSVPLRWTKCSAWAMPASRKKPTNACKTCTPGRKLWCSLCTTAMPSAKPAIKCCGWSAEK